MLQSVQFWFDWLFKMLIACPHPAILSGQGKFYCPHCTEGVIAQWVVLRCWLCGGKRPLKYWMRQIIPNDKCCQACGEKKVHPEYLENPSYFQIQDALLFFQKESEYLARVGVNCQVEGWVEGCVNGLVVETCFLKKPLQKPQPFQNNSLPRKEGPRKNVQIKNLTPFKEGWSQATSSGMALIHSP
jgi:hypothetical protein